MKATTGGRSAWSLPEGRLESRFADKSPPYDGGAARAEAERCLYCHDAPCIGACPTLIDIPAFIRKIATGNLRGSARTILEANLLGASCARVCPVEVLCEGACVYTAWGRSPIAIGRLQRFAMESAASPELLERAAATGRSVGLIGGGPASLACAGTLALRGHRTVIYDKGRLPGGLNSTGVAPYKMDLGSALEEVAFIESLGVEICAGVEVGRDVTAEELLAGHDAIFLGPGLGEDSRLGVPGEEGSGVVGAVEWIRALKTEPGMSLEGVRRAAVIGGGNTAVDVARELAQLGVGDVRIIYRRTEEAMRAYRHEREQARREGVIFITEALVKEFMRESGELRGVELVAARGGRPTDEPRGSVAADLVLLAIGQARLGDLVSLFVGVEMNDRGHIVADPATGATGNARVYAGGDARNGGKEVVNAVAEGQLAARAIDAMLREKGSSSA
ncbi:MAG: FAD-dependent oxidoreductase [Planctomycetota bacterium]